MKIEQGRVKKILILRNDRFGEFLLNIPALRALRETFRNAKIIAVVDPYVRELALRLPFIDEVIEWGRHKHSFLEKLDLINSLKKRKIDIAIMLNPSKEFNILTYLAGIKIRVGYDRKWGFLLTHKIKDEKYLGQRHEVVYNLELVGLVGAKTEDKALFIKVDDNIIHDFESGSALRGNSSLLAIHPWTSDPAKQWKIEKFCALVKKILEYSDIKVVVIGGRQDLEKSKKCLDNLGPNLINLTGKTSLSQLAALLKRCKLLVSGDSGPVHLASCVGTPVLTIFRDDIPAKGPVRWGPWGNGHTVIQKNNLDDISVEEVFDKIKEKLNI
jgi:heptosyltransferase-2